MQLRYQLLDLQVHRVAHEGIGCEEDELHERQELPPDRLPLLKTQLPSQDVAAAMRA